MTCAYVGTSVSVRAVRQATAVRCSPIDARAVACHSCGADQPARPAPSSASVSRASPTTAVAPRLRASNRATFTVTIRTPGFLKTVADSVVKSWSRVPMARTTSASQASACPAASPKTPMGPP